MFYQLAENGALLCTRTTLVWTCTFIPLTVPSLITLVWTYTFSPLTLPSPDSLDQHVYPCHPPLPDYASLDLHVYPFHPPLPSAENIRKIICLFPILGETLLTSGVDA